MMLEATAFPLFMAALNSYVIGAAWPANNVLMTGTCVTTAGGYVERSASVNWNYIAIEGLAPGK